MLTVTLTPELESALTLQADQRGTTPELLAIAALQAHFLKGNGAASVGDASLADFLGEAIGSLDSGQVVSGGAALSEDSGRQFAAGMVKKRRDGKL